MGNQDLEVEFVLAADDICAPCLHLLPDGRCDDVLPGSGEPVPKQAYNDRLDGKLFSYLEIQPGSRMTVRAFLERLGEHVPGIEHVCTHPREETGDRLEGLRKGLAKLGAE